MLPFKRGFTVGFLSTASFRERERERYRETPRETDGDRETRKEKKRHGEERNVGRKSCSPRLSGYGLNVSERRMHLAFPPT